MGKNHQFPLILNRDLVHIGFPTWQVQFDCPECKRDYDCELEKMEKPGKDTITFFEAGNHVAQTVGK